MLHNIKLLSPICNSVWVCACGCASQLLQSVWDFKFLWQWILSLWPV